FHSFFAANWLSWDRVSLQAAIRQAPRGGERIEPPMSDQMRREIARAEHLRKRCLPDIESARVGPERRHNQPHTVAGEAAPRLGVTAEGDARDRVKMAGDLAGACVRRRLVTEHEGPTASAFAKVPPMRSAGSGSWLPAIQIQSRPPCSADNLARS